MTKEKPSTEKILDALVARTGRKMQQARECNPGENRCSGSFTFANSIITFSMSKVHKDIEVWNPVHGTFLDCVAEHVRKSTPHFSDLEVPETGEYDNHGFRSEADYIKYKYG